jgi:hypothetical protein
MLDLAPQTVKATYEGDVLRLHQPLPLNEQQRVWVIVIPWPESTSPTPETPPAHETLSPDEILNLAGQVYEGLSPEDVDEIERLALDRRHFFVERE